MTALQPADIDRAERVLGEYQTTLREARELMGELRTTLKDFGRRRSDIVKLLAAYDEVKEVKKSELEDWIVEVTKELVASYAKAMDNATQKYVDSVDKRFAQLMELLGNTDDSPPGSLGEAIQRRNSLRTFVGEPVAASAEDLAAGAIIDGYDGKTYEVGMDIKGIGILLYLNKVDGKLYSIQAVTG